MAKRGPQSELTDRNWDEEDEPEEAGVFMQAKESILKERQIKKGRRRLIQGTGATAVSGGAFSGFGGFGGFGSKPASSCISGGLAVSSHSLFSSGLSAGNRTSNAASAEGTMEVGKSSQVDALKTPSENGGGEPDSIYLQNLKKLNESFLSWIKMHVEKNPYVELTPVLKDYSDHLKTIERDLAKRKEGDKKEEATEGKGSTPKADGEPAASDTTAQSSSLFKPLGGASRFSFSLSSSAAGSSAVSSTGAGSTGATTSNPLSTTTSLASASAFSGFTFSKQTSDIKPGFSIASGSAGSSINANAAEGTEEEEYEPPKPEVKEIVEEGSVYTKRCKLFYQKESAWRERGLGNVYIKPLEDDKVQLLVRADNTLGTILLNIMLSKSIPLKRQGKNNVFLICTPNPKIDPKDGSNEPVPMLIRVKTETDADDMVSKIKDHL